MVYRTFGDIDPDYRPCRLRQQRAAVPFPARDIEHPLALDPTPGERVPMPVLVGNFAGNAGQNVAGEFEAVRHGIGTLDGQCAPRNPGLRF